MIRFEPIPGRSIPPISDRVEFTALLRNPDMERERTWFNSQDNNKEKMGIRTTLGEAAAKDVESVLRNGGVALEIGAGKLVASIELAKTFSNGKVIAVEQDSDIKDMIGALSNLRRVPKSIENVTSDIFYGWVPDVAFSAYVFDYPHDKLFFLKQVYDLLQDGGRAYNHFYSLPTEPALPELIKQLGLDDILSISASPVIGFVIKSEKKPGRKFELPTYKLQERPTERGMTQSIYTF